MFNSKLLDLQLFGGEGAAEGAGEGAVSGENAVDAEQSRLLELGVPADKIRNRAKRSAAKRSDGEDKSSPKAMPQTEEQAAAAPITEEQKTEAPVRMTWDEIMADPEYNKEMQKVVGARAKKAAQKAAEAEEKLAQITPALELIARSRGLDYENLDYAALNKAIEDDNSFYEERALELGVSTETAKGIDIDERATARSKREEERTIEKQKITDHIRGLQEQGEAMKTVFPEFDLRTELQNPTFARMTSPNGGVSVEDAYYAIHHKEIQAAAMQITAQKTAEKLSNAIQANTRRPQENGISGQAASVNNFNNRAMTKAERESLKQRIREAAARGEKVYPGQ